MLSTPIDLLYDNAHTKKNNNESSKNTPIKQITNI